MPDESESEDTAVAAAADDIAAKITKFLIEGFITKTGREPDNKEIEQLFEELTPERVAELLGEEPLSADCDQPGTSSDEEEEGGDEEDTFGDNDEAQGQDDDQKLELNAKEECEPSADLASTATPPSRSISEATRRPFQEDDYAAEVCDNCDQRLDKRARQ